MGFFDKLTAIAIPAAIGFATGGPAGAFAGAVSGSEAEKAKRKIKQQQRAQEQEFSSMMDFGTGTSRPTFVDPYASQLVVNQGQAQQPSGFFGTVRSGLQSVGGLVQDAFSSGIPQLLGFNRPQNVGQQPAITTVTNVGAQESQGSGSIQTAGMGGLLPSIVGGARSLLKSPLGQIALGGGAGLALQGMGSQGTGMRITRKMKSQARMVLNMTGGNLSAASQMLGIDENTLVMILLKRFRNDGPVVTKAALRKTKQTVRRLKSMCDMYDSLRPTATRRKAPMRRASTTLISNK